MNKLAMSLTTLAAALCASQGHAQTELKVSGDLELFYERSSDIGGPNDDDRFNTEQLYLTLDGKFDEGYDARLKLDGADIVSSDGGTVTEKIVEEANFTINDIAGLPVSVVFGKDEMPFGQDYDKYLNDPLVHHFEIDKVWGVHTIVNLNAQNTVAFAFYENRNTITIGGAKVKTPENELTSNYAVRYNVKGLMDGLDLQVSLASEQYDVAGSGLENETRYSLGGIYKFDSSNVNLEYTQLSHIKGKVDDGDPALITLGFEHNMDKNKFYARAEKILSDVGTPVEEEFFLLGYARTPVKNYALFAEYTNFSSANYKDASDLVVADGTLENSIKLGVKAEF